MSTGQHWAFIDNAQWTNWALTRSAQCAKIMATLSSKASGGNLGAKIQRLFLAAFSTISPRSFASLLSVLRATA